MNKIIKALLEAKFPTVDAETLLEVINSTPNPQVATEILCGLYETPVFARSPTKLDNFNNTKREITFISYDKFKAEITYSYQEVEKIVGWIAKGEEKVVENMVSKKSWSDDAAKELSISEKELRDGYDKVEIFGNTLKDKDGNPRVNTSTTDFKNWQ